MPCPKCDHTLQNLGLDKPGRTVFWCPRCGTLKTELHHMGKTYETHETPKAVECMRAFVMMIDGTGTGRFLKSQAALSGVLESTRRPDER